MFGRTSAPGKTVSAVGVSPCSVKVIPFGVGVGRAATGVLVGPVTDRSFLTDLDFHIHQTYRWVEGPNDELDSGVVAYHRPTGTVSGDSGVIDEVPVAG